MDDIQPFLNDIVAHPHDDAPRLVLADWIEENAERLPPARAASLRAHGEFIRVQYALEGMHPGNPRRPGLLALQSALLQGRKAEWAAPLAFFHQPEIRFRRGFIEHAVVTAGMLPAVGDQLRQAVPLRSLAVLHPREPDYSQSRRRDQAARLPELSVAAEQPLLEQVEELDLSAASFPSSEAAQAWMRSSRLGRLRKLIVQGQHTILRALLESRLRLDLRQLEIRDEPSWQRVESLGLRTLAASAMPALESLAVSNEFLGQPGAANLLSGLELPALSRFAILPGSLGTPRAVQLPISLLARTRQIDLTSTPALAALEGLETLPPTPALESLTLASCWLDADHVERLGRMAERFPALWSLGLRTNRLGDKGAVALAASLLLLETRALDISYCRIGAAGARILAGNLPAGLVSLDFSWNALDGGATDALCRAGSLQALDLSYCGLGDEAALALTGLPAGKLHSLNLGSNRLTAASARVLVNSPALSGLEALDLSNNRLADGFADDLLASPLVNSLRLLVVFGNGLGEAAMARLRAGFRGIVG